MYDAAFNNIENILRAEDGIANELDYVKQFSWLLFLKYLFRYRHKNNPLQDLKKARWYLDRLIEEY